jgi:hypothetical protein
MQYGAVDERPLANEFRSFKAEETVHGGGIKLAGGFEAAGLYGACAPRNPASRNFEIRG